MITRLTPPYKQDSNQTFIELCFLQQTNEVNCLQIVLPSNCYERNTALWKS